MFRLLLTALLLFCSLFASGQARLAFSVVSDEDDCATLPKEFSLVLEVNGTDSTIRTESFMICSLQLEVPITPGHYKLYLRSEKYETAIVAFELLENSIVIDLGPLRLKKQSAELDEVTITGIKRSFIQVDADKTTITVKDNPILTVSSIYDAILKIPGVVPYPGGGFTIAGKSAAIYFEGIPSSLSGDDLINLLKSLPATSVETIEIISNPGASYDANVSGSIININSMARVSSWISGTATLNYGLNQNNKILPSLVMSGKAKKYSWQFQAGASYFERSFYSTYGKTYTSFDPAVKLVSDRREKYTNNFYYFKPSVNYRINSHSNVILSYNGSLSTGKKTGSSVSQSEGISPAIDLVNDYSSRSKGLNNEVILKYRNRLDTLKRVLEITAFYSDYSSEQLTKTIQRQNDDDQYSLLNYNLGLQRFYGRADLDIPFEKVKFYLKTGVKYSRMVAGSLGSYNLQNPTSAVFDDPSYTSAIDFDYHEDNVAGYVELKKGFGSKFSVGAGLRAEHFSLERKSSVTTQNRNTYFNLFPSFNAIYRFNPDMNFIATYARKIGIPSYSQFDPNISGYYDSYSSSTGNSALSPNFYDNAEVKFTVFDYLQLSASYSHSQSLNLNEMSVQPGSLQTTQTFRTYTNLDELTYFLSIPVPFGLFRDGLAFFDNVIDIDKINFLYLYSERTKTHVSGLSLPYANKALWSYGVYSQFILPWKIRMNVDYFITAKGTYQIYDFTKPRSSLEIVLSREFLDKKLKTSISVEDLFNTYQSTLRIAYPNLALDNYTKDDTRIVWFKVSYSFGRYEKPESDNSGPPERQNANDGMLK